MPVTGFIPAKTCSRMQDDDDEDDDEDDDDEDGDAPVGPPADKQECKQQ